MRNLIRAGILPSLAILLLAPSALATEQGVAGAIAWYETATAGVPDRGEVQVLADEEISMLHQDFTGAFRPAIWMPILEGDASLENDLGIDSTLDADSDLGIGDREVNFLGEANLRVGSIDFWLSGFASSRSGSETVNRSFTFGDINIVASAKVDTDLDLSMLRGRFGWAVIDNEETGFRLGPTVSLSYTSFKLEMTATSLGVTQTEKVDEAAPVPAVGVRAEIPIEDFMLVLDAEGLAVTIGDVTGKSFNLGASAWWRPTKNFGGFIGYRYMIVDVSGKTNDRDFTVNLKLHGPFLGAEIRF